MEKKDKALLEALDFTVNIQRALLEEVSDAIGSQNGSRLKELKHRIDDLLQWRAASAKD